MADPRNRRGRQHKHRGLLNLLVLGFATGMSTLRRIEELSMDLRSSARRVLGLRRTVSDTTLFMLLGSQGVAGLRNTLVSQVKAFWRSKRVRNDLFPLGVASFDGKNVWSSSWKSVEGAKEAVAGNGVVVSTVAMLNAVLVSSSVRPCLDLQLIPPKSGESPVFRDVVRRVVMAFGNAVDVITGDAGVMSRENAALVRGLGKHYVFAVKGNQQHLFGAAEAMFTASDRPTRVTTTERRNGTTITRALETLVVSDVVGGIGVYGAQELWRVEQETVCDGGRRSLEARFFVSSLPSSRLTPTQKLRLVRLHWGIENNRHWTLDAIFEEDDRQPCQLSRRSIEVVCWLRGLAYNLVATVRSAAPRRDGRTQPWKRAMQRLRDLMVTPPEEALTDCLS